MQLPSPLGQDQSLPSPPANTVPAQAVVTRRSTGAAPTIGNAVLVAGTVTVPTTAVTAGSFVNLNRKTPGGAVGDLSYSLIAGASITINSASGTDTSTVTWQIFEGS